jgi:hypothetical protein
VMIILHLHDLSSQAKILKYFHLPLFIVHLSFAIGKAAFLQ